MNVFSVRCVFELPRHPSIKKRHAYEERITLWRAVDIDQAIDLAEKEVESYMSEDPRIRILTQQAYWLYDTPGVFDNGIEVFSLIRSSDLSPMKYISRYFVTGFEHSRDLKVKETKSNLRRTPKAAVRSTTSAVRKPSPRRMK